MFEEDYRCDRVKRATGDKGQRYEIRFLNEAESNEHVFGWTSTIEGANQMAEAINLHPSWHSPRIIDRAAQQAAQPGGEGDLTNEMPSM